MASDSAAAYSQVEEYVRKSVHSASGFYGELTDKDGRRAVDAVVRWLSSHPAQVRPCAHSVYDDDCAGCGYHRAVTLLREAKS